MGARRLRGLLSLTERRFADAVADLTAAIDGGHPGPNVHLELALALLGGGAAGADISGADAALQRALAIQLFDRRSDALLAQIDRAVERIESAAAPAPVITLPRPERAGTPDPARRS
jgi:hypothetical protein